jgi:hypothetical protein
MRRAEHNVEILAKAIWGKLSVAHCNASRRVRIDTDSSTPFQRLKIQVVDPFLTMLKELPHMVNTIPFQCV